MAPADVVSRLVPIARTVTTEAVVLRSLRFGEADRILHLYTADRGRVGAIAKGVRRTRSRFGGRLEPLSHVELVLHEGRGELQMITGASLVRSHASIREDPGRSAVGLVGAEAVLKLFPEQERNERVFTALTRFLDLLDTGTGSPRADLDPLGLSFQLKLLWLAGYLPHVGSCAECGTTENVAGYSPRAGGAVCAACAPGGALTLSAEGLALVDAMLRTPLADATTGAVSERGARDALAVVSASYEFHGGFRLRTLSA